MVPMATSQVKLKTGSLKLGGLQISRQNLANASITEAEAAALGK